ncbi:MAG: glycosyltransferase [Rhodocyclaceae bacterium]|nr:glycosyltransferase [Rhodocyclaceae bacterium]
MGDGARSSIVSVCIAHYNGVELIDACIASVRAQAGDVGVEIIVHDDASTDGSASHIRSRHPDVRLIEGAENAGFCVANNRMAAAAQGEYLLLLNNDAALLPNALVMLLVEAERLGRPAILTLPQYDAETGDLLDIGSLLDPFLNPVPNRDPTCSEIGTVHGACLWIPKSLWQELGGFPEWFGSVAEDLYLCCRARLAGYPVMALGKSGYLHRVGQSFGGGKAKAGRLTTTFRRRALSERNKTFVMVLCHPASLLAILLPLHLLLITLEGLLLTVIQWRTSLWREVYAPLLPRLYVCRNVLLRERRIAQAGRNTTLAGWLKPVRWRLRKLELLMQFGLPEVK